VSTGRDGLVVVWNFFLWFIMTSKFKRLYILHFWNLFYV
jgi:hypothetical protein